MGKMPSHPIDLKTRNGGFPKLGYLIGDPHNKEYSILGSILGSPHFGKLPNMIP